MSAIRMDRFKHFDAPVRCTHRDRPAGRNELGFPVLADPHLAGRRVPADRLAARRGGVAEWFRQGPAKPRTAVRFRPPPRVPGDG